MTTITAASSPATQICTWNSLFPYSFSPEADVHDVVCDYADDYDVEAVVADYVAAIDAALEGAGVTLCGINGSSPHMRGAPSSSWVRLRVVPDHPRTCVEHRNTTAWPVSRLGSSPHMRGAQGDHGHPEPQLRIILAHAGSTFC